MSKQTTPLNRPNGVDTTFSFPSPGADTAASGPGTGTALRNRHETSPRGSIRTSVFSSGLAAPRRHAAYAIPR